MNLRLSHPGPPSSDEGLPRHALVPRKARPDGYPDGRKIRRLWRRKLHFCRQWKMVLFFRGLRPEGHFTRANCSPIFEKKLDRPSSLEFNLQSRNDPIVVGSAPLRVCMIVGYDLSEPGGVKHHAQELAQ